MTWLCGHNLFDHTDFCDHTGDHTDLCDHNDTWSHVCSHWPMWSNWPVWSYWPLWLHGLVWSHNLVGPDQNNVEFPGETVHLFLLQGLTAAVDNCSVPSIATQTNTTVRSTTKQLAEKSWVKSILRLSLRKSRNFNSTLCRSDSSQAGTLDWF